MFIIIAVRFNVLKSEEKSKQNKRFIKNIVWINDNIGEIITLIQKMFILTQQKSLIIYKSLKDMC